MTHHVTRQLAEFVVSTSLSDMPDEVVDRAKYFVLDYLGVALRGSLVDSSAAMRAFVDHFAPPGNATLIGCDQGAHPAYAALANGAAAHCIEMDDTHQEGSIHLGAPVISALIAASEMQPPPQPSIIACPAAVPLERRRQSSPSESCARACQRTHAPCAAWLQAALAGWGGTPVPGGRRGRRLGMLGRVWPAGRRKSALNFLSAHQKWPHRQACLGLVSVSVKLPIRFWS